MAQEYADRNVLYSPDLAPRFTRRLDALTDELVEFPKQLDREVAIKDEIRTVEKDLSDSELSEERVRYLAVLEVLLDLVEIGFEIRKTSEFNVVRPNPDRFDDDPQEYKEHERAILQKERLAQFNEQSVRNFIRKMEGSHRKNGSNHTSVKELITSGESLCRDLAPLQDKLREEIVSRLDTEIQPYIQIVRKGEKCKQTGLDLMDIWRYFRYTWLTPYNTVPGRNINFLIRNGAREYNPVMGIASIASPMMNLTVRDNHIGWTIDALEDRLERKKQLHEFEEQLPKEERAYEGQTRTVTRTKYLETEEEWRERVDYVCSETREALEDAIERSVDEIRYDDFVANYPLSEDQFEHPDRQMFNVLGTIEKEAEQVIEDGEDENPEKMDSWEDRSETALFRRKRAQTLQKLLRDRRYFEEHVGQPDTEFIKQALENEQGRRSIRTALKQVKKRRAGAAMMNVMVCGAIPPYNHLIGGKLIGMALTGPEVINAYEQKYNDTVSKIASSMKGEPVAKENKVVFYDTTGLFEVGSAQYDRIRVPTKEGQVEYEELGYTQGYGSIQFGPKTRKRLSQVTEFEEDRQVVRGRFGEGTAPRMRKIRRGLENCGLDGDLLKHESKRIVYGVDLAKNAKEYLCGETNEPDYYWSFDNLRAEQQSIYDHWKYRWASKRIQKPEILERIDQFDREEFLLSREIEFAQRQLSDFIVGNK
jgi:hypothetical protein